MKIKSLIFTIFAVMISFVACDVVPEDDRLIDMPLNPSDRTVLLIEFTGCRCVNCPGAAMVANEMMDIAPENIVVVGMHPADFAYTEPMIADIDFRTREAMDYLTYFGGSLSTGLPVGVVNGRKFDDTYLQGSSKWTAQVFAQREIAPDCLVKLAHSEENGNHTVVATLEPQKELGYGVSLQYWLVESGIVGPQSIAENLKASYKAKHPDAQMGHSSVNNYVHNHVFRGALNGLWGTELGKVAEVTTNSCSFTIDEKYVADNCSVVAVLINTETKEVVQAAEIALGTGAGH
jgi:hypothetical protein